MKLTKFLDAARTNQWATYANKRPLMEKLLSIDAQFVVMTDNLINPKEELAALLLIRCNSSLRAAAGLAMGGQCTEAFVQARSMLENAAYAIHINRNPKLGEVWLNRHQGDDDMKTQKDAFSHRKVAKSVRAANRHACERFEVFYQRTIDFGGHPNERSVTGSLQMSLSPAGRQMLGIMQHGDGPALEHCLKSVAQCGLNSLEMFQTIFSARFELLGISAAMLGLRPGL